MKPGAPSPFWSDWAPEERRGLVFALTADGLKPADIGKIVGVSNTQVISRLSTIESQISWAATRWEIVRTLRSVAEAVGICSCQWSRAFRCFAMMWDHYNNELRREGRNFKIEAAFYRDPIDAETIFRYILQMRPWMRRIVSTEPTRPSPTPGPAEE